jgi:hypothetical protein
MIPMDAILEPYGKVGMIGSLSGERYYWFTQKDKSVSMMPASVVEPMFDRDGFCGESM